MVIVESDMNLMLGFQGKTDSIEAFLRLFQSRVETIEAHGGTPGIHPAQSERIFEREKALVYNESEYAALDGDDAGEAKKVALAAKAMKMARNEYLACLFVRLTDQDRYNVLKKDIINNYLRNREGT